MKSHEFLQEFSETDPNIIKAMKQKGYRYLGAGVDQTAFLEPGTGQVIKIFGTQCNKLGNRPTLSADQKMFKAYAEFCAQNQNNPYLPRIYDWDTFVWDTEQYDSRSGGLTRTPCLYLQIRTEMLRPFNDEWQWFFGEMAEAAQDIPDFASFDEDVLNGDVLDIDDEWYRKQCNNPDSFKRMKGLYDTMRTLYLIGEKHGWTWDLHGGNIMRRRDGTPVITDPWVVPN